MTALSLASSPLGIGPTREKSPVDYSLLAVVSMLLHLCAWLWFQQPREQSALVVPPRVLQLALISVPPPPVVRPPLRRILEPSPVLAAPPPPKPITKPRTPPKPRPQPTPRRIEPSPAPLAALPVPPPAVTVPAPATPAMPAAEPVITPASTRATSRRNPKPDYPTLAKRRGWQGNVLLAVEVLQDGTPGEIQVAKSSGRAVLDNAAIKAVRRWLFEPARRADLPIRTTMNLSIVFKLEQ